MSKELLQVILPLCVGIPAGILTIRYFFKGSILFKITTYWVISLSVLDALANLNASYPETFPLFLTLLIGLPILIYLFYRAAKDVRIPLDESIKSLEKLTSGDLSVKVNQSFLKQNDELGKLSTGIQNLSNKLQEVIENISLSSNEIESTGQQLSANSLQLSHSANEQASSLEEISSTMEEIVSSILQNSDNPRNA